MNIEKFFNVSIFICLGIFQIAWGIYAKFFGLYTDSEHTFNIRILFALFSFIFASLSYFKPEKLKAIKNKIFFFLSFGVATQQMYYTFIHSQSDNILIATLPPIIVSIMFVPNILSLYILAFLINFTSIFIQQDNYFLTFNLLTYTSVLFLFKYYSLKYLDFFTKQKMEAYKIKKLFHLGEFSRGLSHKINNQTMKISLLIQTLNSNSEKNTHNFIFGSLQYTIDNWMCFKDNVLVTMKIVKYLK